MDTAFCVPQDAPSATQMVNALESMMVKNRNGGITVKKKSFVVQKSQTSITIDSWRIQDWDYKHVDLPTHARGLFTARGPSGSFEIVARGYNKFFCLNEVPDTEWSSIIERTQPPYELTLKENGCLICISALDDETLLVCSKHSTGARTDIVPSHASAGELRLAKQLAAHGKTKAELAQELRRSNITAVAELCDDSFEEHVLTYGVNKAGLYLHGINLNLPNFTTYPSAAVGEFAKRWGFFETEFTVMQDVHQTRAFLEGVSRTGTHRGREVEGFVVRCKIRCQSPIQAEEDWFFKYKIEEPYLMYKQWRDCTRAMILGRKPKFSKYVQITDEYLLYAHQRLAADPKLAELYYCNHGVIALRNDFLQLKSLSGRDAARL